MSVTIAILGLAFLVLVHEAGHFFVACAVGMRPRKFYLGFPPALVKTTRRGIEYGLGAIPLGGYVKIPGMHRPAPADLDAHFGGVQYQAPALVGPIERLKRLLGSGDLEGARAELTALEATLAAAELPRSIARTAERGVSELKDGLGPHAYWRQRSWKRVAVIFAGPAANIVATLVLLTVVYLAGVPNLATQTVAHVSKGSPAAKIGLRHGDKIVAINRQLTPTYSDVSRSIRTSHGKPILVSVFRKGSYVELGPSPTKRIQGHWALGFYPQVHTRHYSVSGAVVHAFKDTGLWTRDTGAAVGKIVSGSGRKSVASPVGVVSESSRAVKLDYRYYLMILAYISLSLALLNLLPLLPLDGGHIAFSIIEGIRGRAVGRAVYERVSVVGIALVLLLFIVGLSNDIGRLSGG